MCATRGVFAKGENLLAKGENVLAKGQILHAQARRSPSAASTYADARRDHYLEYVERNFLIFRPFLSLDANSAAAWIPFGKAEFDKICQDAARHVPQEVHIARNVLVQGLNHWIATCETKFRKRCVLEATYGASPLLALETLRCQMHRSVMKTVLDNRMQWSRPCH